MRSTNDRKVNNLPGVENFHRYDSADMVVQIFTQVLVQSRPSDIGNEVFRVFDHSLFLFMWHIKGAACVSSKLSQDFQNWMEKCTILKIIVLEVQL